MQEETHLEVEGPLLKLFGFPSAALVFRAIPCCCPNKSKRGGSPDALTKRLCCLSGMPGGCRPSETNGTPKPKGPSPRGSSFDSKVDRFRSNLGKLSILWMDAILYPLRNQGKPLFVGISREIIIPGCLRWCRISSIHSMWVPLF